MQGRRELLGREVVGGGELLLGRRTRRGTGQAGELAGGKGERCEEDVPLGNRVRGGKVLLDDRAAIDGSRGSVMWQYRAG